MLISGKGKSRCFSLGYEVNSVLKKCCARDQIGYKNNNLVAHEKHNFNLTTTKTMTMMRVYLF